MQKLIAAAFGVLVSMGVAWADDVARTSTSQVTAVPNAAAYVAGNCVGGVLTVPAMISPQGVGGLSLTAVTIVDSTGANASMDLFIFNAAPTGTYTDHAACVVAAADQPFLQGLVPNTLFTCAKDSTNATGICQALMTGGTLPISAAPAVVGTAAPGPVTSNSIWVVPVMRGTPTYGAAQKLIFSFKGRPD